MQGLTAVTGAAGLLSCLWNAPGSWSLHPGPGRYLSGEGRDPISGVSLKTAQMEGQVGGQRPCTADPGPPLGKEVEGLTAAGLA